MRLLPEALEVGQPGGEIVDAAVKFHAIESNGSFYHLLVKTLVRSTQWTTLLIGKKIVISFENNVSNDDKDNYFYCTL